MLYVLRCMYSIQSNWEKLLATSPHFGWTHQVNVRRRMVSYCTEYQAAGSAQRPGLIFYLHSFLLRISEQFSQLFTVKLQSKTPIYGRHVEQRKRPLVWLLASKTKHTQKRKETPHRFNRFGRLVGLVNRLMRVWQLRRERRVDGWMKRQLQKNTVNPYRQRG